MKRIVPLRKLTICLIASLFAVLVGTAQQAAVRSNRTISDDGTVQVPSMEVPFSAFASPEAKQALIASGKVAKAPETKDINEIRRFYAAQAEKTAAHLRERYPVEVADTKIGGVGVRIIGPVKNAANAQERRVLICLHGGSFMWGESAEAEVESIPIVSVSGIPVIGVDYREAPEHRFPDAVDDVLAVYAELLKTHDAKQIGIFGGSAGAILTGETVAALVHRKMPVPGAIGLFNGGIAQMAGDSLYWANPLTGQPPIQQTGLRGLQDLPYFFGADMTSPLVLPANSPELLKSFPPALLLSGSRDFALSSVLYSEGILARAGVETEMHVWDGLSHTSFGHDGLPESQEMVRFTAEFFRRHLKAQEKATK